MVRELAPVDIEQIPELARLVEQVNAAHQPLRIVRGDEDVAVLMPAPPPKRRRRRTKPSAEDIEAAIATFGAWKDQIDPEVFKRERRELQIDDKPVRTW